MQNVMQVATIVETEIAEVEALLEKYESMMQSPNLDCSADEAVKILQSMVTRLNSLYQARDASSLVVHVD